MNTTIDTHAARELALYTINSGNIYRAHTSRVVDAMVKRYKLGTFDESKALKAFEYVALDGVAWYARDFGDDTRASFPPSVRRAAAVEIMEHYRDHWEIFDTVEVQAVDFDRDIYGNPTGHYLVNGERMTGRRRQV